MESSGQVVMWRDDVTYKEDGRKNINFLKIHESFKKQSCRLVFFIFIDFLIEVEVAFL